MSHKTQFMTLIKMKRDGKSKFIGKWQCLPEIEEIKAACVCIGCVCVRQCTRVSNAENFVIIIIRAK